jgi:hypothetical protein
MSKQYKLGRTENSAIYCITNNVWINRNPESRHYREYLAWLAEGNTPQPADAPAE